MSSCQPDALLLLVALCNVVGSETQQCAYTLDGDPHDLTKLKKHPAEAYQVYDSTSNVVFSFNLCGGMVQCGTEATSSACQVSCGDNQATKIGSSDISHTSMRALIPSDIADVNWKTRRVPPFAHAIAGVKIDLPAFEAASASTAGYPRSSGYPRPPGWPSPPSAAWPSSPSTGWLYPPPGFAQSTPPSWRHPAFPAEACPRSNTGPSWPAPPPALSTSSKLGAEILILCDETLPAAAPLRFMPGQTYKARSGAYLFILQAKAVCPGPPSGAAPSAPSGVDVITIFIGCVIVVSLSVIALIMHPPDMLVVFIWKYLLAETATGYSTTSVEEHCVEGLDRRSPHSPSADML